MIIQFLIFIIVNIVMILAIHDTIRQNMHDKEVK